MLQVSYLLDKTVYLLLVLSNADGAVKAAVCGPQDNLLGCISCLRELQPPHLVEVRLSNISVVLVAHTPLS